MDLCACESEEHEHAFRLGKEKKKKKKQKSWPGVAEPNPVAHERRETILFFPDVKVTI
jgi:hypothetical protein